MNALVPVTAANNVEAYRASTDAAELCKGIVLASSSNIQGKRYVSVEGWMAIARAHGCAAGATQVEKVDGGVRAVGEVRDMHTGALIAQAEGFVGEDEPTWYGGVSRGKTLPKRADYAIRAMAQTRAISRACRSAFAHVVVMMNAGLATTPAEEVPHEGFNDTPHNPETGEVTDARAEKVPGITKIKARLREMMTAGNAPDISLVESRKLVHANRADIKTIRDAGHSWWTGDGEDFEGFGPWMERRYTELETPSDGIVAGLIGSLKGCETKAQLVNWLGANGDVVDSLDGADSRTFETAYQIQESTINEMDKVNA